MVYREDKGGDGWWSRGQVEKRGLIRKSQV